LIPGAVLRHAPVWIGMAAVIAVSWLYLGQMSASMSAMGGGASAHAGMAMGDAGAPPLVAVFAMWAVMMIAMMLPTVSPSASVFSSLAARRIVRRQCHGYLYRPYAT
jgi:predicted metal-binding membrane protein